MRHLKDPGLGGYESMSPERVRKVLFLATDFAHTLAKNDPAWLLATTVFGVGPGAARNLCIHAGFDPYSSVCSQRSDGSGAKTPHLAA